MRTPPRPSIGLTRPFHFDDGVSPQCDDLGSALPPLPAPASTLVPELRTGEDVVVGAVDAVDAGSPYPLLPRHGSFPTRKPATTSIPMNALASAGSICGLTHIHHHHDSESAFGLDHCCDYSSGGGCSSSRSSRNRRTSMDRWQGLNLTSEHQSSNRDGSWGTGSIAMPHPGSRLGLCPLAASIEDSAVDLVPSRVQSHVQSLRQAAEVQPCQLHSDQQLHSCSCPHPDIGGLDVVHERSHIHYVAQDQAQDGQGVASVQDILQGPPQRSNTASSSIRPLQLPSLQLLQTDPVCPTYPLHCSKNDANNMLAVTTTTTAMAMAKGHDPVDSTCDDTTSCSTLSSPRSSTLISVAGSPSNLLDSFSTTTSTQPSSTSMQDGWDGPQTLQVFPTSLSLQAPPPSLPSPQAQRYSWTTPEANDLINPRQVQQQAVDRRLLYWSEVPRARPYQDILALGANSLTSPANYAILCSESIMLAHPYPTAIPVTTESTDSTIPDTLLGSTAEVNASTHPGLSSTASTTVAVVAPDLELQPVLPAVSEAAVATEASLTSSLTAALTLESAMQATRRALRACQYTNWFMRVAQDVYREGFMTSEQKEILLKRYVADMIAFSVRGEFDSATGVATTGTGHGGLYLTADGAMLSALSFDLSPQSLPPSREHIPECGRFGYEVKQGQRQAQVLKQGWEQGQNHQPQQYHDRVHSNSAQPTWTTLTTESRSDIFGDSSAPTMSSQDFQDQLRPSSMLAKLITPITPITPIIAATTMHLDDKVTWPYSDATPLISNHLQAMLDDSLRPLLHVSSDARPTAQDRGQYDEDSGDLGPRTGSSALILSAELAQTVRENTDAVLLKTLQMCEYSQLYNQRLQEALLVHQQHCQCHQQT